MSNQMQRSTEFLRVISYFSLLSGSVCIYVYMGVIKSFGVKNILSAKRCNHQPVLCMRAEVKRWWGVKGWSGATKTRRENARINVCAVYSYVRVCGEKIRWVVNLRGRQAGAQEGPLQSDSLSSKQQHSLGPRWLASNEASTESTTERAASVSWLPPDQYCT